MDSSNPYAPANHPLFVVIPPMLSAQVYFPFEHHSYCCMLHCFEPSQFYTHAYSNILLDTTLIHSHFLSLFVHLVILMSSIFCQVRIYWHQVINLLHHYFVSFWHLFDGFDFLGDYIFLWSCGHQYVVHWPGDIVLYCDVYIRPMKTQLVALMYVILQI